VLPGNVPKNVRPEARPVLPVRRLRRFGGRYREWWPCPTGELLLAAGSPLYSDLCLAVDQISLTLPLVAISITTDANAMNAISKEYSTESCPESSERNERTLLMQSSVRDRAHSDQSHKSRILHQYALVDAIRSKSTAANLRQKYWIPPVTTQPGHSCVTTLLPRAHGWAASSRGELWPVIASVPRNCRRDRVCCDAQRPLAPKLDGARDLLADEPASQEPPWI
jgi:hypothetical protein